MENILDYCTISGESVKKYEGSKRYVATGDVIENKIINSSEVDYMNKPLRANQIAKVGDLLFAKMKETKKVIKIDEENSKNIYSTGFCVIRPNEGILTDYIYWVLNSPKFNRDKDRNCKGATQKALNSEGLRKIKINKIPNLEEQQKIVSKLSKIDKIMNKKKKQLMMLDELIKSQFVEMFGTIKENKKDYPIKTLIEVFELIKDGTHSTPVYTTDKENGVKFLSAKDVSKGRIDWENTKYIPIELHEKLVKRIKPQLNDILLAKNGTTGICAKVNNEEIFDIYVSLALLRPNLENSSDYLVHAINNEETKEQFEKSLKGVGVPNLHLGEIKKVKIIVPPITLQNEFSEIVKQIDKQKFEIEKSLKETQELYESLMEKYFG